MDDIKDLFTTKVNINVDTKIIHLTGSPDPRISLNIGKLARIFKDNVGTGDVEIRASRLYVENGWTITEDVIKLLYGGPVIQDDDYIYPYFANAGYTDKLYFAVAGRLLKNQWWNDYKVMHPNHQMFSHRMLVKMPDVFEDMDYIVWNVIGGNYCIWKGTVSSHGINVLGINKGYAGMTGISYWEEDMDIVYKGMTAIELVMELESKHKISYGE